MELLRDQGREALGWSVKVLAMVEFGNSVMMTMSLALMSRMVSLWSPSAKLKSEDVSQADARSPKSRALTRSSGHLEKFYSFTNLTRQRADLLMILYIMIYYENR